MRRVRASFHLLKTERIGGRTYTTRADATAGRVEIYQISYNRSVVMLTTDAVGPSQFGNWQAMLKDQVVYKAGALFNF